MAAEITSFGGIQDDVKAAVEDVIRAVINDAPYNLTDVSSWVDDVSQQALEKLRDLNSHFKYIVTTTIVQRIGAGIHFQSALYWEAATDGHIHVRVDTATMHCIVHVFGVGI
eukprot:GEMP01032594.1.p2 GENE.GEMP01032594.1~~GEMP01032594.1.p2  ORF type:complete len:112 (+),score=25.23 GEMP01032594.1:16-351(+)